MAILARDLITRCTSGALKRQPMYFVRDVTGMIPHMLRDIEPPVRRWCGVPLNGTHAHEVMSLSGTAEANPDSTIPIAIYCDHSIAHDDVNCELPRERMTRLAYIHRMCCIIAICRHITMNDVRVCTAYIWNDIPSTWEYGGVRGAVLAHMPLVGLPNWKSLSNDIWIMCIGR